MSTNGSRIKFPEGQHWHRTGLYKIIFLRQKWSAWTELACQLSDAFVKIHIVALAGTGVRNFWVNSAQ